MKAKAVVVRCARSGVSPGVSFVALVALLAPPTRALPAARHLPDRFFVVHNATVHTGVAGARPASWVCVQDGRVRAVGGADDDPFHTVCPGARAIDAQSATVLPGLTDSHAHLMTQGLNYLRVDLGNTTSVVDVVQRVQAWVDTHPPANGSWVQGFGWDQNNWPNHTESFPTRWELDGAFPTTPVLLERVDGHAVWANTAALDQLPPLPSPDPEGGWIVRDTDGRPTGVFLDTAMDWVVRHVPPPSQHDRERALSAVLLSCVQKGLTGVHDADSLEEDIAQFDEWAQQGRLPIRVYAMRHGATANPASPMIFRERLTVRTVKFFMDGALGSYGAALVRNYTDRPDLNGYLEYSPLSFRTNVSRWLANSYQVATHAIGDRANRVVLDAYEHALGVVAGQRGVGHVRDLDLRLRVEHAQILNETDLPRFAAMGVLPSMQPTHCTSDMPFAETRLGHDRTRGAYAWHSLLASGVRHLPFGSDFPTVGQVDPLLGLYAAVTRQDASGSPPGGWFPDQRVSRAQALRGYTLDAAFASFRENELGTIEAGKWADLTVLDRDVMDESRDPRDILHATVLATVVGGEVVWAHNSSRAFAAVQSPWQSPS